MVDLSLTPDALRLPIARVVEAALTQRGGLQPEDLMIVGARCRDILHHALGHTFPTSATADIDVAVALTAWDAYDELTLAYPREGDTGIRFRIAGEPVDLLPFGDVENPTGSATPASRGEPMSVWAFDEIFKASLPFDLPGIGAIRIPTVAGYAAAKLGAWLDRSEWHEAKDATDVALVLYWYSESAEVADRLYDTDAGRGVLLAEGTDVPLAGAHLLGADIADTIGPDRLAELLERWPGNLDLLVKELVYPGGARSDPARRRSLVDALTRGLRPLDGELA